VTLKQRLLDKRKIREYNSLKLPLKNGREAKNK
jgi:hypothetical protein